MGKRLDPLDLEAARGRVIEAASDAVEARDDGFPNDEMGRLGDAIFWLGMVQTNVALRLDDPDEAFHAAGRIPPDLYEELARRGPGLWKILRKEGVAPIFDLEPELQGLNLNYKELRRGIRRIRFFCTEFPLVSQSG